MTSNDPIMNALTWAIEKRSDMYCTYKVEHIELAEETDEYKAFKIIFTSNDKSKFETRLGLHKDGRHKEWQVGTRHADWLEDAASLSMIMAREIK